MNGINHQGGNSVGNNNVNLRGVGQGKRHGSGAGGGGMYDRQDMGLQQSHQQQSQSPVRHLYQQNSQGQQQQPQQQQQQQQQPIFLNQAGQTNGTAGTGHLRAIDGGQAGVTAGQTFTTASGQTLIVNPSFGYPVQYNTPVMHRQLGGGGPDYIQVVPVATANGQLAYWPQADLPGALQVVHAGLQVPAQMGGVHVADGSRGNGGGGGGGGGRSRGTDNNHQHHHNNKHDGNSSGGGTGGGGRGGHGNHHGSGGGGGGGTTRSPNGRSGRNRRGNQQNRRDAHNTGVDNAIIEEFRNNKNNRDRTIFDIQGKIVDYCKDQNCSRFIQQRLECGNESEQRIVADEVLPEIRQLRDNVFGNYVVQKLLEFGTPQIRIEIRDTMRGEMLDLSLQEYG